jgi:predicted RNase H-like nuclease (RuvC/YqgF family)
MYNSQVNEYKYDIEKLNRELQDVKNKYFQSRKKLMKIEKDMAKNVRTNKEIKVEVEKERL